MFLHTIKIKEEYVIIFLFLSLSLIFTNLFMFHMDSGLPEINRKFSETGPFVEKMYDKQLFMSIDNFQDSSNKTDDVFFFFIYLT